MRLRVWVATPSGPKEGGEALLAEPGFKWIDVEAQDEAVMARLGNRLGLHPLAVEDALHFDQRPKLEDYPNHLFFVLHGHRKAEAAEDASLEPYELHFYLGTDWLLTVHDVGVLPLDAEWAHVGLDCAMTLSRGADFVAYQVADAVVSDHFPLLDKLSDDADNLWDAIFEGGPSQEKSGRVFGLKRMLSSVRRLLAPQRDVLAILSREGVRHVQTKHAIYFRDVYDHLVRVHEQLEDAREQVTSALEAQVSVLANRTNEITKQLTLFAAIFLPLSFIAGFFGQNFEVLSRPPFFVAMCVAMVTVPLVQWLWFRHKHWD
ncbi:MAG: magnesium transporter CorA family protein [Myxococcaceae bacterium]